MKNSLQIQKISGYQVKFLSLYLSIFEREKLESIVQELDLLNRKTQRSIFLKEHFIENLYFLSLFDETNKTIFIADKNLFTEIHWSYAHKNDEELLDFVEMFKNHKDKLIPDYLSLQAIYDVPTFEENEFSQTHEDCKVLIKKLSAQTNSYQYSFFEKISDFGLNLVAQYDLIRIHILKFLAVLPTLDYDQNGDEVKRIFLESMRRLLLDNDEISKKSKIKKLPLVFILAFRILIFINKLLPAKLMADISRYLVGKMAQRFIAGENIKKSQKTLEDLKMTNREATLDQLGELVVSKKEAESYESKVLELIDGVVNNYQPFEKNGAGIYKAHISIKVSALCSDFKPQAFNYTYSLVAPRLKKILLRGFEKGVFVNIDAEHIHFRDLVFKIYKKVLLETPELHQYDQTGIVVQAYLRDGIKHLFDVIHLASERKMRMPVRLVKGAYWDAETIEACAHNYQSPQFLNKSETDLHFKQMVYLILKNNQNLHLAVASHNIEDHAFAESCRTNLFPQSPIIEHQCLHMTYEALSMGMSQLKWPVRNYMPIGNLLIGMAYLVRRIMENSSQVGILAQTRSGQENFDYIKPWQKVLNTKIILENNNLEFDGKFKNIYPIRLYKEESLRKVELALKHIHQKLPFQYGQNKKVISPSDLNKTIGYINNHSVQETSDKIQLLFHGFIKNDWSTNLNFRIKCMLTFAHLLKSKREELSALIVFESGKTITEAIADVDEAIDFVNFYLTEFIQLYEQYPQIRAKGVIGVIAPWNFPLAIPCGMTVSALMSGNAVILKPAEQSPIIAIEMVKLMIESGIPHEIIQIVLGDVEVGQCITSHELINGVLFTGSKTVGTLIYRQMRGQLTSSQYPFPPILKTVVAEMGGKNAIIVTSSAELDETVSGIIYSAFAHAGQKCSAASRIIVDKKVQSLLEKRLSEAVHDIKVGESYDFSTSLNPIITEEDKKRIQDTVEKIHQEVKHHGGKVLVDLTKVNFPGNCVGPTIVSIPTAHALNNQTFSCKEIFGPVIHIVGFDNLDQALQIFNNTEYALTGGIFSQSQDDIDYLLPKLECGNIYINRPNTGARVAIEPFGGFKMSGTGPKAGGRDYLKSLIIFPHELKKSAVELNSSLYNKSYHDFKVQEVNFHELIRNVKEFYPELDFSDTNFKIENVRSIPGQKGYNDFTLGQTMMVLYTQFELNLTILENILMSLVYHRPIIIIAANQTAYSSYSRFLDICQKAGLFKEMIDVVLGDSEYVANFMQTIDDKNLLMDLDTEETKTITNLVLNLNYKHSLPKFSQLHETKWKMKDKKYIFVSPRTLAINTMRHGAPLELEVNHE
jgi:RHH-type proline utilization regulon transcriptional repressor/proline dehydrogenase/delta 1-pyrroline-5-carboxylate dehydrogenase